MQRHLSRRLILPVLLVVALMTLIQAGRVLVVVRRLETDVRSLKGIVDPGSSAAAVTGSWTDTEGLVAATARDFRDLRSTLGIFVHILPAFGWFPYYGGEMANAPALVEFGAEISTGAEETISLAHAVNQAIESGRISQSPIGVTLLYAAQAQEPAIREGRQHLLAAAAVRDEIDEWRLSPSRREMILRLDRWLPLWMSGLDLLLDAPDFLGAERPRTYLMIAQNSDELRATGGFISGVAQLRIERGEISLGEFQDSLVVDDLAKPHPNPPEPLSRYMYAGQWLFRDANWSPDWPTAARQIEELHEIDHNIPLDGVIAINLRMVPGLIEAVGPIEVEAYGERVDATNVVSRIQTYWSFPQIQAERADWWSHRKDFVGQLLQVVVRRLMSGSFDRARLVQALSDALTTKDLLFYLDKGEIAAQGSLYAGAGDALMVVDSNVGFNKVDNTIGRQADYSIALDHSGAARSSLVITYTNYSPDIGTFCIQQPLYQGNYSDLQQGCYWNYVRVAVPAGAQLLRTGGIWDARVEDLVPGRIAFGGYMVLPRGQTKTVRFDFHLPPILEDESHYSLRWEKQPGAPSLPVHLSVVLPNGFSASSDSPFRWQEDALELQALVDRDQVFSLEIKSGGSLDSRVIGVAASSLVLVPAIVYALARRRRALQ